MRSHPEKDSAIVAGMFRVTWQPMKCLVALLLIPSVTSASDIRIASLNVNFRNEKINETIALVANLNADVILLQESNGRIERRIKESTLHRHEFSWFTAEDADAGGGFAVLSRLPLVDKVFVKKSAGAFGAQQFGVRLGRTTIQFINFHLNPAPLPKPFTRSSAMHLMMLNNKAQVLEIQGLLARRKAGLPTVMAGDLNSFASFSAYKKLIAAGFTDAHLACDTNAHAVATWKMNVEGHQLQGRFDYIFHDARLTAKSFAVVECPYSDHDVLSCTLEVKD